MSGQTEWHQKFKKKDLNFEKLALGIYESTLGETLVDKILGFYKTYSKISYALSLICQNKQSSMKNKKVGQNFEKSVLGTYESTLGR